MSESLRLPLFVAGAWGLLVLVGSSCAADGSQRAFSVDTLAPGVHLFRPADEGSERANSLVVERQDGLLVVDAQPTPKAARELLAAIAAKSPLPVRYLVLSHPHAEAAGGASAFPDSVLTIGSAGCLAALEDGEHDFGAEIRARLPDPEGWNEPVRRLPTLVIHGDAGLGDAERPVRLIVLGRRRHSDGDMMVFLPREDVLYIGGLLFTDRNPYAKGANMAKWLATLNRVIKQSPRVIVGVRGPAADGEAIRGQRDALAWVRGQVESRFLDQLPIETIREQVIGLPELAKRFDVESSTSFVPLLIDQLIEEGVAERRKRGLM